MSSKRDTVPVAGDLFDAVLDATASLIVVADAEGQLVRWNRSCERLTGYRADELRGENGLLALMPADEHELAIEILKRLIDGESPVVTEVHWRTRSGDTRLIRWSTTALTGPDGRVTHAVSNGTDVTETEREAAGRAAAEERLSLAFDGAPIGMALADVDGRFVRVNRVLCDMTGYTEAELLQRSFAELVHPDDADSTQLERRFVRANGDELWVEVHTSNVPGPDGGSLGVLGQIVDVSGRRQLEDRLRHLADHDSLTGLINRRRFEEELERHVSHGRRYGMDGALLVLDLDGFKDVNDQYGHRAGDRVLASVAAVLRKRLRETDLVARFGGDEFAVLLPHAAAADAKNVAQTLAEAIATEVTVPGGHLSASVGFAVFEEGVLSPDDVLSAADAAMYAKKGGGRPGGGGRHLRPVD
jgi:diguanylate cyclase (GGDEF)-like protein/PAS domain S-box-containing protein